jgi:photosynthetic reaction center cytochrome c subunit
MNLGSKRMILPAIGMGVLCLLGNRSAQAQTVPEQKPLTAGEFFKNVKVLTRLPVNEFMTTMGFFSASLGYSCENCHGADTGWENYAAENREKKQTARRMILMMSSINKTYFGGRQVLTCYSCHRGGDQPQITPNLAALYSPPPEEPKDIVQEAQGAPSADQIFNKYLQALGDPQRLASLTSFVATGTIVSYGVGAEKQSVEIYGKAPGQRTTIIHSPGGDDITTVDGRSGWIAGPQIAGPDIPVPVLGLTGGDLDGLKLEADLSFPSTIKQALSQWRVGLQTDIDDRQAQVVQGSSPGGAFATLYFDADSGLLVRVMRYTNSVVGRFPTQIDYSDYREVSGVKVPFRWTVVWLDGRETFELTEVKLNVPIDAIKFAKPGVTARPPAQATNR